MMGWWNDLTAINRAFYCAAAFFSIPFLWQLAAALVGLGGGVDADDVTDASVDAHDGMHPGAAHDGADTMVAFRMLSVRSIVTFFTLFAWGGALYLNGGAPLGRALGLAAAWGLAGMLAVALLLYLLPRLAQTGTRNLETCVGTEGTVYLDIPADGTGEVRATVSGTVCYVKARSRDGQPMKAGTPVQIVRRMGVNTVEVKPA